jgi:hypothetical protein
VLQVCAEALSFKRNPQCVLVHGVGVLGPVAEVVRVQGEGLAEVFYGLGGFVEEDLGVRLVYCWYFFRTASEAAVATGGAREERGSMRWWGLHHACVVGHSRAQPWG